MKILKRSDILVIILLVLVAAYGAYEVYKYIIESKPINSPVPVVDDSNKKVEENIENNPLPKQPKTQEVYDDDYTKYHFYQERKLNLNEVMEYRQKLDKVRNKESWN